MSETPLDRMLADGWHYCECRRSILSPSMGRYCYECSPNKLDDFTPPSPRDDLHAQAQQLAEQIVTDLCSDESALVLHATRVTEQIQQLVDEAYRQGARAAMEDES